MPSVPESARAIAEALAPEQGAKAVRWRWGTVLSVQSDGTMTVHVSGADVSGIRAATHVVGASSGDRVRVSYYGTEAIVDAIRAISDQGGGGALTGVKGDAESTYRTGNVNLTPANLGLGNVDNTSDASKPISTATQAALDGKADAADLGDLAYLDEVPNHSTAKLTSGTLGVARGGTGKASHTVNSILTGGTTTTGAVQDVATASGALYATSANGVASFGTLPIAQGGTGATTAADARENLLAVGYTTGMDARFIKYSGSDQIYGLYATCINANNTSFNGKSMGVIFRNGGISLYNSTDSNFPWQISGLSGIVNLGKTTLVNNAYETITVWGRVVTIHVHGRTGTPGASGNFISTSLASYLPSSSTSTHYNISAIVADASSSNHVARLWVDTSGNIKLASVGYTSSAAWYGTLTYIY